jgi:cation:H+ antiporter
MLNLLATVIGFIPLIYGADILVESASSLAKRFNIPPIVIGLTIVSFGTSAPEFVINFFASLGGNTGIVLGNVLGSNIVNIMGILGLSAVIRTLDVRPNTTWIEIPLSLLAGLAILVLGNDAFIDGAAWSGLSRIDGIILLFFLIIFLSYNVTLARAGNPDDETEIKDYPAKKSLLMMLAGLLLLSGGGRAIVFFATRFATDLGISERVIALTIISIGTSLPELATSVVAAIKKRVDIAIGNVVGSNIFNVFFVLGASAVIHPVTVSPLTNADMAVNIGASVLLFTFVFTGKGRAIERWEGAIFCTLYVLYLASLVFWS